MGIVLGANQYGKAENRVVRIVRDTPVHEIRDLNVSTSLRGEFTDAHVTGDQSQVLPTDTQKNTAFAYAKLHGISSPEDYALALGRRLVEVTPAATECEVRVEEYAWDRIGDHSFVRRGGAVRTAFVTVGRDSAHVESGEIDMAGLGRKGQAGQARPVIKPQYDEWVFPAAGGRGEHSVLVLAEGRLLNLGCATGHPSFVMSSSFTNQVVAQLDLHFSATGKETLSGTTYDAKRVYILPKKLDEMVARLHLDKLGVKLTTLSKEQADYIGVAVKEAVAEERALPLLAARG